MYESMLHIHNTINAGAKMITIDLFRSGKTIGEINTLMGFETMMTAEIISMNIEDVPILRMEAK